MVRKRRVEDWKRAVGWCEFQFEYKCGCAEEKLTDMCGGARCENHKNKTQNENEHKDGGRGDDDGTNDTNVGEDHTRTERSHTDGGS